MRDDLRDFENHILRARVLDNLAIEHSLDAEFVRIGDDTSRDDSRTDRCPSIESLAHGPLATTEVELPLSVRDVVANSVAGYVVHSLFGGNIVGVFGDDHDELALVVDGAFWTGLSNLRDVNIGERVVKSCGRLVEVGWAFRDGQIALREMLC